MVLEIDRVKLNQFWMVKMSRIEQFEILTEVTVHHIQNQIIVLNILRI